MKIFGNLVDIYLRKIYPAEIAIGRGIIENIKRVDRVPEVFILPGLIDSHIHIESSMITPGAFGYEAVKHGTVGVVSDPHEIANIMGWRGVEFMIQDAERSPLKFWFGAPSCVPATSFETSGSTVTADEIERVMGFSEIKYLSEMMNFPGVISREGEVIRKINAAKKFGKPIDGHAPGLSGTDLKIYVNSGISTDHECSTMEEAEEKILMGMKILIREGSAARNLDSLKQLFNKYPDMVMLCSDDLHPEMLVEGHINKLVGKLVSEGFDLFNVIRSATINPVNHYKLDTGLLRKGDSADFITARNLTGIDVVETWINGEKVFSNGKRNFSYSPGKAVNNFNCRAVIPSDLGVKSAAGKMRIIKAFDGNLHTEEFQLDLPAGEFVNCDPGKDILKIAVKDRYRDSPPALGFINGFGLKEGAFAGSIAHDSHNIICIGTNDNDIAAAINEIVKLEGGLAVSAKGEITSLQLNIGGIMTTRSCVEIAREYSYLNDLLRSLGCTMQAPFMTLSFMALLVIPDLKIGDRGLFDVNRFSPVSLFVDHADKSKTLQ